MKKYSLIVSVLLLAYVLLAACGAAQTAAPTPTPQAIELVDGLDRQVRLPGPAQRVVSLAPSNIEILFAIGAGAQVVGRDEFTNYPTEATSLPSVGGSFGGYNEEAILNLNPDLVLAAEINTPEQVKSLEALGLTVYYLKNPTTLEGMYDNLLIVAALTGRQAEAAVLVEQLKQRAQAVEEKIAPLSYRPSVFYEIDATDPKAPYTSGPGTFVDLLISKAGGFNIGSNLQGAWAQISVEELLVQDPAIILLGDSNYGITVESVAARAGWEGLTAIKNGAVYPFNDDLVSRPGPRMVDGLEELAKLLHPEVFK